MFFLLWSIVSMITYDTRVLLVMLLFSIIIFRMSKNQLETGGNGIQIHIIVFMFESGCDFLLFPLSGQ